MKRRYQIEQQRAVQQFRRLATEQNPNIQMILPMADIVGLLQQGVGNLLRDAGLALMNLVMDEEVRHWPASATSNTRNAARIAGARKTATAWWMARKCRSRGRGCAPTTSANNAWGATNCFSATGLCSKASGTR